MPKKRNWILNAPWVQPGFLERLDFSQSPPNGRKAQKYPSAVTKRESRDENESRAETDHYTVAELAKSWGLSQAKIRALFRYEPDVIKLLDPNAKRKRKRIYVTLRIPPSVADRVHKRLS